MCSTIFFFILVLSNVELRSLILHATNRRAAALFPHAYLQPRSNPAGQHLTLSIFIGKLAITVNCWVMAE